MKTGSLDLVLAALLVVTLPMMGCDFLSFDGYGSGTPVVSVSAPSWLPHKAVLEPRL